MTLERLLHTSRGTYRAPWRLATFAAAAAVGLVLANSFAYPLLQLAGTLLGERLSLEATLLCVALLLAHGVALRWLDGGEWGAVGLDGRAWRPRALATGTLVGTLGIGVPILLLVGVGWLSLVRAPDASSLVLALRLAAFLAPAALWEELAFRGYVLRVLADTWGDRAAVLVSALAFGLIHLANPGADLRSTLLVSLAGIWLGIVRVATGSLPAAWLAHWAWNWTMAGLWHAPVSGVGFGMADWQLADTGPDWATGGTWGPEGGAFAALGMIGGSLWFLARPAARPARAPDDTKPGLP